MEDYFTLMLEQLGIPIWFFFIIFLWVGVWKMLALWKSARNNSPGWFVILALFNTMGILEIIYLFGISKIQLESKKQNKGKPTKRKVSKKK